MRGIVRPPVLHPIRHVPYYAERELAEEKEYTEEIKNDKEQGLGVPSRSLFLEVFDTGTADAYAEVIISDGTYKSEKIPLKKGVSINYGYWDAVYAEWVKVKAKVSWVKYRIHAVPGVWE